MRLLSLLLVGCGTTTFTAEEAGTSTDGSSSSDSTATDAGPFHCSGTWAAPMPLSQLNLAGSDNVGARFTYDGLTVVFSRTTGATSDVFTTSRPTTKDSFGATTPIAGINLPATDEIFPSLVGNELYFARGDAMNLGLYVAMSPAFANPMPVRPDLVASGKHFSAPYVLPFGKVMYFTNGDTASIMRMERSDAWGAPSPVTLGGPATSSAVTPDETRIYFGSDRGGNLDVWTASRKRATDAFGMPVKITELSTSGDEVPTWVSLDDCSILLQKLTQGNWSIFYSLRTN